MLARMDWQYTRAVEETLRRPMGAGSSAPSVQRERSPGRSPDSRAGILRRDARTRRLPALAGLLRNSQWLPRWARLTDPLLDYRCGGSVGVATCWHDRFTDFPFHPYGTLKHRRVT